MQGDFLPYQACQPTVMGPSEHPIPTPLQRKPRLMSKSFTPGSGHFQHPRISHEHPLQCRPVLGLPLKPPASPASCQYVDPALQVLFHRAPQLVPTLGHCSEIFAQDPCPAPLRAMARVHTVSRLPQERRKREERSIRRPLEVSTCPGQPLTKETCLSALKR